MNNLKMEDPVSSWGLQSEKTTNASGLTFAVKFMGFVPIPISLLALDTSEDRDALLDLCIETVVTSQLTDKFKNAIARGEVKNFVGLNGLEVRFNVSTLTITFFHIVGSQSRLLGRYKSNKISRYKTKQIGNDFYFGMVTAIEKQEEVKRECNVFWLGSSKVRDELLIKLKAIDNHDHNFTYKLEARLKSTQDYDYKVEMLSFYHGKISHEMAIKRLSRPGDFLFRESTSRQDNGKIVLAISYIDQQGYTRKELLLGDALKFAKNWQNSDVLKFPVRNQNPDK